MKSLALIKGTQFADICDHEFFNRTTSKCFDQHLFHCCLDHHTQMAEIFPSYSGYYFQLETIKEAFLLQTARAILKQIVFPLM